MSTVAAAAAWMAENVTSKLVRFVTGKAVDVVARVPVRRVNVAPSSETNPAVFAVAVICHNASEASASVTSAKDSASVSVRAAPLA